MVQNNQKSTIRTKNDDDSRLISVVCPVYNSEKTVAGAITSILTQTYDNWELILVDDGSTDHSEKVIRGFKDERIHYFKKEHLGIPATRNFGNSKATGDYIVIQDSDDYSLPDRLEKISRFLDARPNTDVLIHSAYVNSWDAQYNCMNRHYIRAESLDIERLKKEQYLPGWACFRKSVWREHPYREETKYAFDWMMHLDWALNGAKYDILDEGLYEYVRYSNSASDRFEKSGKRAEAFEIIKKILENEYS